MLLRTSNHLYLFIEKFVKIEYLYKDFRTTHDQMCPAPMDTQKIRIIMPEKTREEIEKLEEKTDEIIEKIKKSPKKAAKGVEKELEALDKNAKNLVKKIQTSSEKADNTTKKTWSDLAERAHKVSKKINRSWTELVKASKTLPRDP